MWKGKTSTDLGMSTLETQKQENVGYINEPHDALEST